MMDIKQKIDKVQAVLNGGGNVIKTRDDRELILVDKENEEINKSVFRTRIEPWLTSLFQSEHLSLLCGSGITNAVSFLAGAIGSTTMGTTTFSQIQG